MKVDPENESRLIELAVKLEAPEANLDSSLIEPAQKPLDDATQKTLDRFKNALDFIEGARLPSATESNARDLETHPIAGSDTLGSLPFETAKQQQPQEATHVSRFELIRSIGEGGFANVWLAHDHSLDRRVALKLLKVSHFSSADVKARFDREAKAAAALNHPGIVPVFETGQFEGERYIASEFCDGETLDAWRQKQPYISQETAARFVLQLADALEHAHQRGVVHRDLKPANILLDNNSVDLPSSDFQLKVTDFGLAKQLHAVDSLTTTEGMILGTPAYMSPEQAHGKSDVGPASDLYSLGVILYELLTGKVPHRSDSHLDTLLAIRQHEPTPPRRLKPSIAKDLEAICLKCLAREPSQRYARAHDLSQDLQRWLNGETVHARRATGLERASKWCQRNPTISVAFLLVASTLGIALWQWSDSQKNLSLATAESERAQGYLEKMTHIVDGFLSDIERSGDPSVISDSQKARLHEVLVLQTSLIAEQKDDVAIKLNTLRAFNRISAIQNSLGNFEAATENFESANKWLEEVDWQQDSNLDSDFVQEVVDFYLDHADNYRRQSRIDKALATLDVAEEVLEEFGERLHESSRLRCHLLLHFLSGLSLATDNRGQKAHVYYQQAAKFGEALLMSTEDRTPETIVPVAAAQASLSNSLFNNMQFQKSLELSKRCEELLEQCVANYPDALQAKRILTRLLKERCRLLARLRRPSSELRQSSGRAIELGRELVAEAPLNADIQVALAATLGEHAAIISRSDPNAAFDQLDEAIDLCLPHLDELRPARNRYLALLDQKAWSLSRNGRIDEALKISKRAISEAEAWIEKNPDYHPTLHLLGTHWQRRMGYLWQAGLSQQFVNEAPDCYQAIEKLLRHADDSLLSINNNRQIIASVRGMESTQLARLGRFDDAVAKAESYLDVELVVAGKTRKRYLGAATALGRALTIWEKQLESSDETRESDGRFEEACQMCVRWLTLAVTENGFDKQKVLLNSPDFAAVRQREAFKQLLNRIEDK